MKVVIDTNVVVSAVVWGGVPGKILEFVIANEEIQWCVTELILAEYAGVLSRSKFALPEAILSRWANLFARETILIEGNLEIKFPRDQGDAPFLVCAILADADFLISGDRDFESIRKCGNTKLLSAAQFKTLICDV